MRELSIPPDARNAQQAVELIRAWIIDGEHQCSLFPTIWAERPETWGLLLADVAHHIAEAASKQGHHTKEQMLRSIASKFASEVAIPTGEHSGHFIDAPSTDNRTA